jgi:hypothetical protein
VLIPGSPLGLITEGVQVLAGVLLPSATVFLLLLCNDREVLGPWVNGRRTNAFTSAVIAVLITLSVVLTASVLFPAITAGQMVAIFAACGAISVVGYAWVLIRRRAALAGAVSAGAVSAGAVSAGTVSAGTVSAGTVSAGTVSAGTAGDAAWRYSWRMPPLAELGAPALSRARKLGLAALRGYLAIAMIMVIVKVVLMATAH